ncbi:MAG: hypothetical protein EOO89_13690, partial [Pedobacter sp.]
MENPCYEVYKNGLLLCKAGLSSETGVLASMVTWVKRKDGSESNDLNVRGLNSQDNTSLSWLDECIIIGDEITIKVVKSAGLTQASSPPPFDEERYKQDKINAYYLLREELKT